MGKPATSTTTATIATPAKTKTPKRPAWLIALVRTLASLWLAFVLYVAEGILQGIAQGTTPPLLKDLLPVLTYLSQQPPYMRVVAAIVFLAVLAFSGWLTYRAWRMKQEQQVEAARQRVDEYAAGAGQAAKDWVLPPLGYVATKVTEIAERLEQEMPALPANIAAPAGLPRPASLVGRDKELATLMDGLRAGRAVGVFALQGMGGIGKSALAAEAVARLAEDRDAFPGGAAWISVESLSGAEGLAELWARVARTLGLEEVAALTDAEQRRLALGKALASRPRTLLALDNVERELDTEPAITTLAVNGHIALLLTARETIPSPRLQTIELYPLEAPDAETLFVQRLRQRDPNRPDDADRSHVPTLAEAVGGLPLAVELLAGYAGAYHVPLVRLSEELTAEGINAAAFRFDPKRALVRTFERSWRVLVAPQQRLFSGLSLLTGASFPREAALAIARASQESGSQRSDAEARDDLDALIAVALVETPSGDRLRLHPLLRQYAAARLHDLGPETETALGGAMLAYWLTYAQSHPGYEGMDALETEAEGLMGALEWAHSHERWRDVLGLAHALNRFWFVRRRIDDSRIARPWGLEAAVALEDQSEERWSQHELALLNSITGQLEAARQGFEQALAAARQLHDPSAERRELHELAELDRRLGHLDAARDGFIRAKDLAVQLRDPSAEFAEIHSLALIDAQTGQLEAARQGYEQALALARQLHDPAAEATELRSLGIFLAQRFRETETGRAMILESLTICERLNALYEAGKCHQFLAAIDRDEGNRAGASAHFREALRRFEQMYSPDADEVRNDLRRLGVEP